MFLSRWLVSSLTEVPHSSSQKINYPFVVQTYTPKSKSRHLPKLNLGFELSPLNSITSYKSNFDAPAVPRNLIGNFFQLFEYNQRGSTANSSSSSSSPTSNKPGSYRPLQLYRSLEPLSEYIKSKFHNTNHQLVILDFPSHVSSIDQKELDGVKTASQSKFRWKPELSKMWIEQYQNNLVSIYRLLRSLPHYLS